MPIFEYKCKKCRAVFDEFRYSEDSDISKDVEIKCPVCGTPNPDRIFSFSDSDVSDGASCGRSEYGLVRG